MRIIQFDGNGTPSAPDICTGNVLILLQGDDVTVVRLELLPPDDHGPSLDPAVNSDDLTAAARAAIMTAFPDGLSRDRHWVLECPLELAQRARFRGD